MAFKKITQADTTGKWVEGIPDTPGLTTAEMQAKFDEISRDVVIPAHNELVDQLEAANGSAGNNIKVVNPKTSAGGTLNETLSDMEQENTQNTQKAHTHDNKSVLDAITSAVKTGYDRLVTLFTGITGIDNSTLTNSNVTLPTSKTTKDYVDDKVTDIEGDITALGGTVSDIGEDLATTKTAVDANTAARHTHENKSVLDTITSAVKTGYDRVVTLFANITGIDSSVTSATNKIPTSKAVKDKTDTMQTEITANTNARHTHSNKSVLDAITSTVKTGYDRLVSLFTNITGIDTTIDPINATNTKLPTSRSIVAFGVELRNSFTAIVARYFGDVTGFETTLTNTNDKAPTSHAVKVYVDEHGGGGGGGGGDMYKSTYDTNDDGVVDDAERFNGHDEDYFSPYFKSDDCVTKKYLVTQDIAYDEENMSGGLTLLAMYGTPPRIVDGHFVFVPSEIKPLYKNLLNIGYKNRQIMNGITVTQGRDYSFHVSGTASADAEIPLASNPWIAAILALEDCQYLYFKGCSAPGGENTYGIRIYITKNGTTTQCSQYNNIRQTIRNESGITAIETVVYVKAGQTVDMDIYPMLYPQYVTNTDYDFSHGPVCAFMDENYQSLKLRAIPVEEGSQFENCSYEVNGVTVHLCADFASTETGVIDRRVIYIESYTQGSLPSDVVWMSTGADYAPGTEPPTGSEVIFTSPYPSGETMPPQYNNIIHCSAEDEVVYIMPIVVGYTAQNPPALVKIGYAAGPTAQAFGFVKNQISSVKGLFYESLGKAYDSEPGKDMMMHFKFEGTGQILTPKFYWEENTGGSGGLVVSPPEYAGYYTLYCSATQTAGGMTYDYEWYEDESETQHSVSTYGHTSWADLLHNFLASDIEVDDIHTTNMRLEIHLTNYTAHKENLRTIPTIEYTTTRVSDTDCIEFIVCSVTTAGGIQVFTINRDAALCSYVTVAFDGTVTNHSSEMALSQEIQDGYSAELRLYT